MKLLKAEECLLPSAGGNVNKQTMIVEGRGTGFRTRVRFSSTPFEGGLRYCRRPFFRSGALPACRADAAQAYEPHAGAHGRRAGLL